MDKLKKINRSLNIGPVFFVAPNPNRAIGLEKLMKNFHIICSHRLDIVEYLRNDSIPVFCLDDDSIKNTGKILENGKVLAYIKENSQGEMPNIITFKPSPKIEKICELNGFNHIGNDWRLNRKFENKINFVDITKRLKIPNAKSRIITLTKLDDIKSFLSKEKKCVVQFARGFSGNSTFLIENKNDFDLLAARFGGRTAKVAEYISGDTITINGCVSKKDVYVGKPIYQITGLTDYNGNKLGTSGNDYVYSKSLPEKAGKKIFDCTKKIGSFMKKSGYKGIFGLDFIVGKNGGVNLIEINPRLVGSIPMYTKLQIENGEFPFLAIHIQEFTKGKNMLEPRIKQTYSSWKKEVVFDASQLILRNVSKKPLIVEKTIPSGIYKNIGAKLYFQRKSYCIEKKLEPDEVLIQCSLEGGIIGPDMEYANIQASYGIIEKKTLKNEFSKIAEFVLKRVEFKEIV